MITIPGLEHLGRNGGVLTFQIHPGYYYCGTRVYYCTTPPTPVEWLLEDSLRAAGIAGISPEDSKPELQGKLL